jgi:hypothetical protein
MCQSAAQREQVESKARSYAKKMKAKALVFTSSTHSVNVNSLFKVRVVDVGRYCMDIHHYQIQ